MENKKDGVDQQKDNGEPEAVILQPMLPGPFKGRISGTIFWYLFRETLFAFAVSFMFFFFIFFVNQILLMAKDILEKSVPFNQVARLVVYALPSIVAISSPFASLLGTLMTIGRLSSDNEILVMLASGLSYKNIFIPTIIVGILISIFSFIANDILLPLGTIHYSRLYRQIVKSTPALEIEANSVKRFKDTFVITGNVHDKNIQDLLIIDKTSDGERRVILANDAEFVDAGKEGISLNLRNAFVHSSKEIERSDYDYAQSRFLRYRIKPEDLMQDLTPPGPREMTSIDVFREIKKKEVNIGKSIVTRTLAALDATMNLENALRAGPGNRSWTARENLYNNFIKESRLALDTRRDRSLSIWRLEFYKKFSIPLGALSFIFLAVPLGLLAKKSGQAVGFIVGLIISLIYWAFLLIGQNMGIRLGYSPFWSMWFPNVLSVGIGIILTLFRVRR
ncbi:MAG: LptF/LptG family permease [Spirochaetaceae bacterium]|jgi:lipopolysaccharide export system permease protein|nr:LptF/LptG family permease [Spirochaetaceae bacterium]